MVHAKRDMADVEFLQGADGIANDRFEGRLTFLLGLCPGRRVAPPDPHDSFHVGTCVELILPGSEFVRAHTL